MTFFLGTYSIYTNGFQIPHLKEKKKPGLIRVCLGHPGHGSTYRVARVWPGYCYSLSFIKPGPVQLLDPESTRQARFNNTAYLLFRNEL
jgi:hypothetical protein